MRLLWLVPLLLLVASVALLARAIFMYQRSRLPLPASLLGGVALNGGLALLIVPQFLDLSSGLRWIALAISGLLLAHSLRLSRRALRQLQ